LLAEKFLDHAEQQIKECGATVVWWDPLVSFHNRNENDNVAMRNVLDAITYLNRKTDAASIVIHHFGQPTANKQDEIPLRYRLRGASAIRDWADTIITLRTKGKAENPGPRRVLDFTKIRNGPQRAPLYLERDRNFVHHVTEDSRKASPITVANIVSEHQGKNGFQGSQNGLIKLVMKVCDCSTGTAHAAIKEALRDGYVREKVVDGMKYYES
jgi:RecA-family ATPase